jgi:formylglycine-generating enzyme required for sulfatase activity
MGNNPSRFKGAKNPVEQVGWDDAQAFLARLQAKAGGQRGKLALPTEAQWEYACRAGGTGKFCFGDDEKRLGEYAWFADNSGHETHPVGEKKPNAWGLYDLHGNVLEWCQDWYSIMEGAEAVTDPTGPETGSVHVLRGGCYCFPADSCRSAFRYIAAPEVTTSLGFRVALVPAEQPATRGGAEIGPTAAKTASAAAAYRLQGDCPHPPRFLPLPSPNSSNSSVLCRTDWL